MKYHHREGIRMHKSKLALPVSSLLLFSTLAFAQAPNWTYNPNSRDSPLFWGSVLPQYATCGSAQLLNQRFIEVGMKQTPIDIVSSKAVPAELTHLGFHYDNTALNVENT